MSGVELAKLDDALARLLATDYLDVSQKIPVAVQAAAGSLEVLVQAVNDNGGTVRHVLGPLNAIAAWMPMSGVAALAALEFVEEIEMDRVMHVA
ncbi:MAG TPA: hypothetical protein VF647_22270 [Longimicrobium sp.]|jgi:hypothetical protein